MTVKQIKQQLEEANSLLLITNALSDLSSMRLKKIRASVERNIFFFNEIAQVYHLVKKVAAAKKIVIPKNGQTLSIVITSNFRFYGNLNTNLLKYFISEANKIDTKIIVIGTTGNDYLKGVHFQKPFQPVVFQKDMPSDEELKSLADGVKDYSQILVFYPKFKTVLTQIPAVKDITESSDITEQVIKEEKLNTNFIFEPEIKKTLDFFDSQLTTLLLEETFLESELARVAARLITTSQAEKAAEDYVEGKKKLYANARRTVINNNLLESLSSFSAVKSRMKSNNF